MLGFEHAQFGIFVTLGGTAHLIFTQSLRQVIDLLFRIADQRLGESRAGLRIGRNHFHLDDAFSRIEANFHVTSIHTVCRLVCRVGRETLKRVYPFFGKVLLETQIGIKPHHGITRLKITLNRNRILTGGQRCAREHAAQSACRSTTVSLLNDKFRARCEHRRGIAIVIRSGQKRGDKYEKDQTRKKKHHALATPAHDIALNFADFFGDIRRSPTPTSIAHRRWRAMRWRFVLWNGLRKLWVRRFCSFTCDQLQHVFARKRVDAALAQLTNSVEVRNGVQAVTLCNPAGNP